VTFGRLGRAFLVAGGVALVAAALAFVVFEGSTRAVVAGVLALIALIALIQGVVWLTLQHRMFGSIAAVRRTAETGRRTTATIVAVHSTSSRIGADPIVRLDLLIDGHQVTRRVRVPFNYAAEVRAEKQLPVRTDPQGSRALIVEWDRLS
jgi:hypothetical protein